MACFTKTQQCNRTNCEYEKYVTMSNFFVLNSLAKSHLNSVCTEYVCDKSENAWVCAKWQWNALDWCFWIALPASPVVQTSNTVSCISLSFCTHLCVLAICQYHTWYLATSYHLGCHNANTPPPPNTRIQINCMNGLRNLYCVPPHKIVSMRLGCGLPEIPISVTLWMTQHW